jgi:predicted lipid-binding transport protein (Tim44 family)
MPLSEQEQRLLEEMERGLYHNDADFVANVGGTSLRPNYRSISLGVLAAVAGIGGLIAGVAIQQLWLGVLGFIIMFAGVLIATTPSKNAKRMSAAPRSRPTQQRSPDRGFMDRMNERWDRRQDGQQ